MPETSFLSLERNRDSEVNKVKRISTKRKQELQETERSIKSQLLVKKSV